MKPEEFNIFIARMGKNKDLAKVNPHLAGRIGSQLKVVESACEKPTFFPNQLSVMDSNAKPRENRQHLETDGLNKTECTYLGWIKAQDYPWYGVQCITIKLAFDCRLTMDFAVWDGHQMRLIDTKAFNRKTGRPLIKDDALVKMKVAAKMFSFWRFEIAYKQDGQWVHKQISG